MHIMAGQDIPVEGRRSHEQTKDSTSLPLLEVPQNPRLNNHNIYVEGLTQTHAGSMIAVSASKPL